MNLYPYKIVRKDVKNVRIKVCSNLTVLVVAPASYKQESLENLIAKKKKWIAAKLEYFSSRPYTSFITSEHILLYGEKFQLIKQITKKKKILVNNSDKNVCLSTNLSKKEIEKQIHLYAKKQLQSRIKVLSLQHKLVYNKLFIRSSKSKWANCSTRKNISLNYRLIHMPQNVIDYVIMHELLHTIIMNHSKVFWIKLSQMMPSYKISHDWLHKSNFEIY